MVGGPYSLGRAVANLIGNAVAHGRGQGQMQIIVSPPTLDVVDDGLGCPPRSEACCSNHFVENLGTGMASPPPALESCSNRFCAIAYLQLGKEGRDLVANSTRA